MRRKLLLADDEEDILMLLSATLSAGDRYDLIQARDGEEALRLAQQEKPALVFLDIMMPKLDGFEVCSRLKADSETTDVKVVMITALAQDFDRRRADEVGADHYVTKPFSPMAVLRTVDELLGS